MTLTLTAEQLSDFQVDLDIGTSQAVFTDAELNRFYNRANGVFYKAEVLAFRVLLVSSSKWVSYTEGQTTEARSDRFKQVKETLDYLETVVLQGNQQYAQVHIRSVPTPARDAPYDRYCNGYGYGNGSYRWRNGGCW